MSEVFGVCFLLNLFLLVLYHPKRTDRSLGKKLMRKQGIQAVPKGDPKNTSRLKREMRTLAATL